MQFGAEMHQDTENVSSDFMQNILLPLYKAALQSTSSHTENLEDSPESSGDINIRPQERNGTITEGG